MSACGLAWLSNVLVRFWLQRTMQCGADPKLPAWTSRHVRSCRNSLWKVESACSRSWKKQTKRCIRKFESQDYTGMVSLDVMSARHKHVLAFGFGCVVCVSSSICCICERLCWQGLYRNHLPACFSTMIYEVSNQMFGHGLHRCLHFEVKKGEVPGVISTWIAKSLLPTWAEVFHIFPLGMGWECRF